MSKEFELSVSSTIEIEVKAKVPTGGRNGWRNITFFANFEPMTQDALKGSGLTVQEAMEKALKAVDFGTLKLNLADADGNALSPLQVALGNVYTHNALTATFRDEVLQQNIEGKHSRGSR